MKFEQWTAKSVEERVVEAAATLMLVPHLPGPGQYGTSMPTPVHEGEGYGYGAAWYKRRPTAGALSRMTETWGWINALRNEADRKLLYAWAWTKARRGKTVDDFASREGVNSRTLRRAITRICQRIADDLNQKHAVWLNDHLDSVSENPAYEPAYSVADAGLQRSPNHIMMPGAKPVHDREHPDFKRIVQKIERGNKRRKQG
jgi:hypothetical protein